MITDGRGNHPRDGAATIGSQPGKKQENAIGILRRRYVPIVILDHLDRGAHLLGEEIYVDALRHLKVAYEWYEREARHQW